MVDYIDEDADDDDDNDYIGMGRTGVMSNIRTARVSRAARTF